MQAHTYHHQKQAIIAASQAGVFADLDDQTRRAAPMEKRSMMMLGGRISHAVYIDHRLPLSLPGRWLGLLFAGFYARWCVSRMLDDAVGYFQSGAETQATA